MISINFLCLSLLSRGQHFIKSNFISYTFIRNQVEMWNSLCWIEKWSNFSITATLSFFFSTTVLSFCSTLSRTNFLNSLWINVFTMISVLTSSINIANPRTTRKLCRVFECWKIFIYIKVLLGKGNYIWNPETFDVWDLHHFDRVILHVNIN